jgi:hypothetical protein
MRSEVTEPEAGRSGYARHMFMLFVLQNGDGWMN